MIPRLWQCAGPTWWEYLVGLPLSGYALAILLAVAPLVRALRLPGAVLLPRALLHLGAATISLLIFGVLGGVLLRVADLNPSRAYEAARWLWLAAGWPILAFTAWMVGRNRLVLRTPRNSETIPLVCLSVIAASVGLVVVLLQAADFRIFRAVRWFLDDHTTWLQTDACLAEHRLQYLTHTRVPYDFDRFPGDSANDALFWRGRNVDRRVYAEALRSYRYKVRERLLPEPETLQEAMCASCPGVVAELEEWVKDERLSEHTRSLAEVTRSRILHPSPPSTRPHDDRRLRYPDRPWRD